MKAMTLFTIYDRMPFGRHEGELISDIFWFDYSYLAWLINETEFFAIDFAGYWDDVDPYQPKFGGKRTRWEQHAADLVEAYQNFLPNMPKFDEVQKNKKLTATYELMNKLCTNEYHRKLGVICAERVRQEFT